MDLSIVIPAFKESEKIAADIKAAATFLQSNQLDGEIIVVDDGSTDDTAKIAKSTSISSSVILKVLSYQANRGKGYAVRTGMRETNGEYVMFADSGCCVPYRNVSQGLDMLKSQVCEIAHGSRKLMQSNIQRSQSMYRRICSGFFKWLINKILPLPPEITDSQCGFKIYRGDVARQLYAQCISDGFMFDIEIILRAQKQGYRIKEFSIQWTCDLDSRVSLTRAAWPILSELIAIKRTLAKE